MTCFDPPGRGRKYAALGFTLIEVVVAMLIASMIVTVVFSGLGVAFDAWTRTTGRLDELETSRYAGYALRRQLEGALPLRTVVEEGLTRTEVLGFEGERDSIRFVSGWTFGLGPSGPARWVVWEVEDSGIRVREYDIVPPENRPAEDPAWEGSFPFSEDPDALEFTFRRPRTTFDPVDSTGEWVDEWEPADRRTIPDAVRVHSTSGRVDGSDSWMVVALDYADSARQGMRLE